LLLVGRWLVAELLCQAVPAAALVVAVDPGKVSNRVWLTSGERGLIGEPVSLPVLREGVDALAGLVGASGVAGPPVIGVEATGRLHHAWVAELERPGTTLARVGAAVRPVADPGGPRPARLPPPQDRRPRLRRAGLAGLAGPPRRRPARRGRHRPRAARGGPPPARPGRRPQGPAAAAPRPAPGALPGPVGPTRPRPGARSSPTRPARPSWRARPPSLADHPPCGPCAPAPLVA
jgi:hypothetical protein